jgi:Icc-related predicted phosphoesterase
MKIIAVSDIVVDWIYSPQIHKLLSDIDLVVCCGDLPDYYMEYMVSSLDKPLFQVRGNHSISPSLQSSSHFNNTGSIDIHRKVKLYNGYSFAGVEGSLLYNQGAYQYSQFGMWLNVFRIVPRLLVNRLILGCYLNVFVTHAPPWGIHDQPDLTHQGIKAFRWLIATFQPDYHVHGRIHVYRPDTITETRFGKTIVLNAFRYKYLNLPVNYAN